MDDARTLSAHEVAAKLGLTVHQVYRRIQRGDLPAVMGGRQGKQFLVKDIDLQAYIDAGQPLSDPARDHAMISTSEAAMLTGLTPQTIRRLCEQGLLEYRRESGRSAPLRIFRGSVNNYLSSYANN